MRRGKTQQNKTRLDQTLINEKQTNELVGSIVFICLLTQYIFLLNLHPTHYLKDKKTKQNKISLFLYFHKVLIKILFIYSIFVFVLFYYLFIYPYYLNLLQNKI